jgi:negative regulator of sigma E activity
MSEDLDATLRKALRPVDPGEDFTARVMARVAAGPAGPAGPQRSREMRSRGLRRFVWLPAALAAGLVLVVVAVHLRHVRQEEAGLAARDQVMEALRVTSQKLDLAYRTVNAPAPADERPGA